MKKVELIVLAGIRDSNQVEIVDWSPEGYQLNFPGNTQLFRLSDDPRLSVRHVHLGAYSPGMALRFPGRPDVIFNSVCSPESSSKALEFAEKICNEAESAGIGVINHPKHVRVTTRTGSAEIFGGLDHVVVPEITLLSSPTFREVVDRFERGDAVFPALIRTTTEHDGRNIARLDGPGDMDELGALPFDGRDYYLSRYVEYANSQGIYRKYRLVKVGGKVYARHMISSREWNIHATQRRDEVNGSADEINAENSFLKNPKKALGGRIYDQLVIGLKRTNLDYAVVDFSVLEDGRAVFFESNACFNVFSGIYPRAENAAAEKAVTEALVELVLKAGAANR